MKRTKKITGGSEEFPGDGNVVGFGSAVAFLGDVAGSPDKRIRLAVGERIDADGAPETGAVWVLTINDQGKVVNEPIEQSPKKISQSTTNLALDPRGSFGAATTNVGDLDGDGINDLAVGAWRSNADQGAVWLLFLEADGSVKSNSHKLDDTGLVLEAEGKFGHSVANIGDVDGNGWNDLAVGSPANDDGEAASNRGVVYVLLMGDNGSVESSHVISSTQGGFSGPLNNNDNFGSSLGNVGDLNGDGLFELAVGTPGDGSVDRGAVWCFHWH